jgi:transaldolase
MPEKTLDAVADHGVITGDTISNTIVQSQGVFLRLEELGIDLEDVFKFLEEDGVAKFEKSWAELLEATQAQLDAAKK